MEPLHAQRLLLRNFVPEDWQALSRVVKEYMASPMHIYDHQWPTADADMQRICAGFAETDAFLAVCLKENQALIGYLCLHQAEDRVSYDLGYCIAQEHHGKGLAYEACAILITAVFSQLGAVRITAGTAEANTPSRKLLARLGMEKIGEGDLSFAMDEEGNPITFRGFAYELTPVRWAAIRSQ